MDDIAFSGFLTFCEEHLKEKDALDLKKLMIKRYNDCNHDFKVSNEFKDLVYISQAKIDSDPSRIFVHLRDFLGELKAYKDKKGSKKKNKKRVRDSGLSDSETPSPKSFKGDNSESSSDEKFIKSAFEQALYNNKSGTDSDFDSGIEQRDRSQKTDKTKKSAIVNGNCHKSDNVIVLEVASQSDDDDIVLIEDDNNENDNKHNSNSTANENKPQTLDQNLAKSTIKAHAFQDVFKNFTNSVPRNTEISDKSRITSSESEDNEESENTSSKEEIKEMQKGLKSCSKKDIVPSQKTENLENDTELDSCCAEDKNVLDSSCAEDKIVVHKDEKEKNDIRADEDAVMIDSPKPSTSSNYKEPGASTDSDKNISKNLEIFNGEIDEEEMKIDEESSKIGDLDQKEKSDPSIKSISSDVDMTEGEKQDNNSTESKGTNEGENTDETQQESPKVKKASKRQIRRLEQLLQDIRDQIEKLKQRELSLEDLDDDESAYVLEDKYQKKFVKVWNKLCELKGRSVTTGRPTERKFVYHGTRFPQINRKIEKFINKSKVFPDYGDIHNIVAKINSKNGIGLRGPAVDRLAREAFADVGDKLQKRRKEDLNFTFLGHLGKNSSFHAADDPALNDVELKKTLDENKRVSKTKIEEIINKYVEKQDECDFEVKDGEDPTDQEKMEQEDEEDEDEETEDIEVPEINSIIESDSEEDERLDAIDKYVDTVVQENKDKPDCLNNKDITTAYEEGGNSGSDENEEEEKAPLIDKDVKVVVTDICKLRSPYKVGLEALVKESEQIVIETEELEVRSRSISPELKSQSLSSTPECDTTKDSVNIKSRSSTPELNIRIMEVHHVEDDGIDDECENTSIHNEEILCEKFDSKNIDGTRFNTTFSGKNKSVECVETISIDSSGNNSDENSPSPRQSTDFDNDGELNVKNSHIDSVISSQNDDNSDLSDITTKIQNSSQNSDVKLKAVSGTSCSLDSPSNNSSTSFTFDQSHQNDKKALTSQDKMHVVKHSSSSIEPTALLNRIVTVARSKLKLKKPPDSELKPNSKVTQPLSGDSTDNVIEIDDSEEENSGEIQNQVDDDDDDDDCFIILSDSD